MRQGGEGEGDGSLGFTGAVGPLPDVCWWDSMKKPQEHARLSPGEVCFALSFGF